MALIPAVFLDRDGTIIEDKHYLNTPEQIRYLKGVREGLVLLKQHGFELFVVSNQSGVGRGYFGFEMMRRINRQIELDMHSWGVSITQSEFCPHHPNERCGCRKPGTAMFERIFHLHPEIDLSRSFMVGDSKRDMVSAEKIGLKKVLLSTGPPNFDVDYWTPDFFDAARWIIQKAMP